MSKKAVKPGLNNLFEVFLLIYLKHVNSYVRKG